MPIIHTGMPTGTFADASITAAQLAANAVTTVKILDGTIAAAKAANAVVIRDCITIVQDASAGTGAAGYMPFDGDIVACSFFNDNPTPFDGAGGNEAHINVTAGEVCASANNLASLTTERDATPSGFGAGLSKGAKITLTAGTDVGATGPTVAIVEVEGMLNALG